MLLAVGLGFLLGRRRVPRPSDATSGQLWQSSTPEAGKSYWMAFSNKGRMVKRGERVNVVISGGFELEDSWWISVCLR